MTRTRMTMLATIALFTLGGLTGCLGTRVPAGQKGIKDLAFGGLSKTTLSEGFYFQWWWNDIVRYDVTWKTRSETVQVLTADDLHLPTTVTVTFRVRGDKLYDLHTQIGRSYYEDVIQPSFKTLIRSEFARHKHNDLARSSPVVETRIQALLAKELKGKPLEIGRVSISHIRFDRSVTQSISAKLVKQQQAAQKRFELDIARQDADIARTRAQGVGDSIRIRATGEAAAMVLKGEAQAKAQKAIAKTLTKAFLQYKAFDGSASRYYFLPTGKDGLPLIINAESR